MRLLKQARHWTAAGAILASALLGVAAGGGLAAHPARAEAVGPSVYIDDTEIPNLRAAYGTEGRLIVPMRPFFEGLGAKVYWDAQSRMVRVFLNGQNLTLQVDNLQARHNDKTMTMDLPPQLIEGRVFVPLRFVAEALAGEVTWDAEKQAARIVLAGQTVHVPAVASLQETLPEAESKDDDADVLASYTAEEIELLARIINAEAYSEPYKGKVAVGAVIMNRVNHPNWPNSIHDVVHAPGQFTPVRTGKIWTMHLRDDSRQAAMASLRGEDPTGGAIYFNSVRFAYGGFWNRLRNRGCEERQIGNQVFFRC